jgi:large subunit ribosomal protein L29
MMQADEIRDLSVDEILSRLDDTREELMNLRFRSATGELTDTNQMRTTRRLIARLLTVLQEKEREVEGEA